MYYTTTNYDLYNDCLQYMGAKGLAGTRDIIADGKIKRYSADSQKNKQDEWYVAYAGTFKAIPYLTCFFGSWSTGERHVFKSYDKLEMSPEDRTHFLREYEQRKKDAEIALKELHNIAAVTANRLWVEALNDAPSEDYLIYPRSKGIQSIGAKYVYLKDTPRIVLPLTNIKGEIRSLQFIYLDHLGKVVKRFLPHGEKRGNFLSLGNLIDGEPIYVAEGWATGVSIYQTKIGSVVIAYDANNLAPVIENIKKTFPQSNIIIAADNDEMGLKKAREAAQKFGSQIIFPEFPENNKLDSQQKPYKDFNDLYQISGLVEVRRQLTKTTSTLTSQESLKNFVEESVKQHDPCATFSVKMLPPVLANYINSICSTTNAHPIMVTSAVLGTISAFMGRKVFIQEYYQKLYTNLWMINIAGSGQFKTTALYKGARLAISRSAETGECINNLQKELQFESDQKKIKEIKKAMLEKSLLDVVLPNKLTTEALIEYLSQGHSGVILTSEFGGWLLNLEKNYNGDLKALITELYDVPTSYRYKTRTQGDFILLSPFISICGVSTVAWLKANIKIEDLSSGFFARFLIFMPPFRDEIPPALPVQVQEVSPVAEQNVHNILENMDECISYTLSESARTIFADFHKIIYETTSSYSDKCREILEPHTKRWSPCLLKVAMMMQFFLDPQSRIISAEALYSAFSIIIPAIKSTALLIERELGESPHQHKCRKVFEWICKKVNKDGSAIKRQTLLQSKQLDGGVKDYDYILTTLIEQGKIICQETGTKNNWLYMPAKVID